MTNMVCQHAVSSAEGLAVLNRTPWPRGQSPATTPMSSLWGASEAGPGISGRPSFIPSLGSRTTKRRSGKARYIEHVDASDVRIRVPAFGAQRSDMSLPLRGLLGRDDLDALDGRGGFSTSMLYAAIAQGSRGGATARPAFASHVEEGEVASLNVVIAANEELSGTQERCAKLWHVIPPLYLHFAVNVLKAAFPVECRSPRGSGDSCVILDGRKLLVDPAIFRNAGVPVTTVAQRAGDLVILAPGAIHFGENRADNIALSVNAFPPGRKLTKLWAANYRNKATLQDGNTLVDDASMAFFERRRHV